MKYRITVEESDIENCPTEQMLANPFTNSPQEQKFLKFHSKIMNIPDGMEKDKLDWYVQATASDIDTATDIPYECVGLRQTPPGKKSGHNTTF